MSEQYKYDIPSSTWIICVKCGEGQWANDFYGIKELREYRRSGLCQKCQKEEAKKVK